MVNTEKQPFYPSTQWQMLPPVEPSPDLQSVAAEKKLHPVIVKLLAQRGYQRRSDIESFLHPRLADLPNPLEMQGMKEAAAMAGQAVVDKIPIVIWGDYDVDGITGTALLVSFFRSLGVETTFIIPNRITHGYGLYPDLLQTVTPAGSSSRRLLITVDCGISANDEICAIKEMGYQVIVTDHHEPPDGVSPADAVLNPKKSMCTFPSVELAGVGVAFYLACGIRQSLREINFFHAKRPEPDVRELLDLVALGTIADMVPLGRINRVLVKEGMRRIEQLRRCGIKALLSVTGLLNSQRKITGIIGTEDIGFLLAPMINAAGRIADADIAVQLLLSSDPDEALPLAQQLLRLNLTRKEVGEDVYFRALAMQKEQGGAENLIILKGQFHGGVVGIVASRLVEAFGKPVILFSETENDKEPKVLKGSARSIDGINIHTALEQCSQLLLSYGGHAMAAGMSVALEDFDLFQERMNEAVGKQMRHVDAKTELLIDLEVEIDELFAKDYGAQVQLLEPFGPGNKSPVFAARKFKITDLKTIGADDIHLRMIIESNGVTSKGVAFKMGPYLKKFNQDVSPAIAYSPIMNRYRDNFSWQVKVLGFQ